jgi:hypothetical protein
MKPEFVEGHVRATCPDCGTVTSFEYRKEGQEHGGIGLSRTKGKAITIGGTAYTYSIYKLLRCAACGRGGMAELHSNDGSYTKSVLGAFHPLTTDTWKIPSEVPPGIASEFREAEKCASVGAWRGGSALFRSVLEKALKANGYTKSNLADKIDEAAADGAITTARSRRAHEDVRVLGNDILHDEWRAVTQDEYDQAHHYTQRILEDLYDDRATVVALLTEKGRIGGPKPPS